jgi:hypothetical protein
MHPSYLLNKKPRRNETIFSYEGESGGTTAGSLSINVLKRRTAWRGH